MRGIFLIVFMVTHSLAVLASTDTLYLTALRNYEEGRYEESLQQLREILNRGVESPVLYYNMGNAAYRSNQLGYSILYYEKALKLDPGFKDASYNLSFVEQFTSDRFEQVPELFITKWIKALVNRLQEKVWAIISISAFIIFLTGILIYVFALWLPLKKAGFFTALVFLFVFGFSAYATTIRYKKTVNPDTAIIISPSVIVKSSPSDSGNDLFILHEGTKVDIQEEVSGWRNVRIIDGRTGWIPARTFLPV